MNITVSEAKAKFADLIRRVEAGEEIVLTRNGKPVARLSEPVEEVHWGKRRQALKGKYKGKGWIAPDFDELGPEWDEYM